MKVKDIFTTDLAAPQPKIYSDVAVKKKAPVAAPASSPPMTINIHVEKPDIILLEDMDDINSHCIVLNVDDVIFTHGFNLCNKFCDFADGAENEGTIGGRASGDQWVHQ